MPEGGPRKYTQTFGGFEQVQEAENCDSNPKASAVVRVPVVVVDELFIVRSRRKPYGEQDLPGRTEHP